MCHTILDYVSGGPSREVPYSRRKFTSNGSSSNVDRHTEAKLQMNPRSGEYVGASNWHTTRADNSKYSQEDGNVVQLAKTVGAQKLNRFVDSELFVYLLQITKSFHLSTF